MAAIGCIVLVRIGDRLQVMVDEDESPAVFADEAGAEIALEHHILRDQPRQIVDLEI